jgi:DNA repair exonuclease SbcCD nuclease subunit
LSTVALISDQHFDRSSRWEEHLRIMSWIVDDLRARKPATILLGGDLFERRPTPEEMRAAIDWVRALAEIAEVVGVYGNHEPENSLYPLTRLETVHPVTIYAEPAIHRTQWGAIACLPWPRRAHLLAALGSDADHQTANQVAVDALRNVLRGLGLQAEQASKGRARVLLSHCQVRGARLSSGQPLAPGADFELGLEDLALVRADAYLFGHIHRRTELDEWSIDGAPALYAGSPRRTAFGEVEEKSYAIVDVSQRPAQVELVATPCARMYLLEGEFYDDHVGLPGDVIVPAGLAFPGGEPTDVGGAEIRVRYRCESDRRDAARAAAGELRDRLLAAGAVAVKLEEQVIASVSARIPEIARANTIADKLEALWSARGVALDEARKPRVIERLHQVEQEERAA